MKNPTLRAWRASFTRRWHGNFDLCDTTDYDCGHQGRVALLILSLFPDASRTLLAWAIVHDQGEVAPGDVPYPAKVAEPALRELVNAIEAAEIKAQGFDLPNLTEKKQRKLKLCDSLDAWLWMMRHARHLAGREDWIDQRNRIVDEADWFGIGPEVREIIETEAGR